MNIPFNLDKYSKTRTQNIPANKKLQGIIRKLHYGSLRNKSQKAFRKNK